MVWSELAKFAGVVSIFAAVPTAAKKLALAAISMTESNVSVRVYETSIVVSGVADVGVVAIDGVQLGVSA